MAGPDRIRGRWRLPVILALLVVLVASALVAWQRLAADRPPDGPPDGPPERLRLAASMVYAGSAMLQLAQEQGYFRAEGLDLQIREFPTGKAALEAVFDGAADLATAADLPIVFAILQGQPVSIVGTLATSESGYGVVARKDRGIATAADLQGRRIGLTAGTSAHFWLDAFLLREHMMSADVRVQPVPSENLTAALAAGEVDAVCTWQPYLGQALQALGANAVLLTRPGIYDSPWNLAGSGKTLAQHAPAIRRLLRAVLRAERAYAADPEAALAAIARARGINVAELRSQLGGIRFALRLDQSLLGSLEDESRWAMRSGIVPPGRLPNFLDHLAPDALAAVQPSRVGIIR